MTRFMAEGLGDVEFVGGKEPSVPPPKPVALDTPPAPPEQNLEKIGYCYLAWFTPEPTGDETHVAYRDGDRIVLVKIEDEYK